MTLTKEGKEFNKLTQEKLVEIKKLFVDFFSTIKEKDISFILDIKIRKQNFMRFCEN